MLRAFTIHAPATVIEASDLLDRHGVNAAVYAGGTELLVLMKEGLADVRHLIDIKTIPGLNGIAVDDDGTLRIGPLATHRMLERSPAVRERAPLLAELAAQVANVRVRAAGTIGGNLCFAEPHSDPATLLVAWGATLALTSTRARRELPVGSFFLGLFETARAHEEVLTEVRLRPLPPGTGGAYERFSLHERPTATVAALLGVRDGVIESARLAIGSVGPVPVRVAEAEEALIGERPTARLFTGVAELAAHAIDAADDPFESAVYKRQIARVLTERTLTTATRRAGDNHA